MNQTIDIDEESPSKLKDKLLQSSSNSLNSNITGSGNLVFGKSIKNMKNKVEKNNKAKVI